MLGCGYVLVSLLLGHGDFGHEGGHAGGLHEVHVDYGINHTGHGTAEAGHGFSSFHFPFFSPLALATLLGAIGAFGLIALHGFETSEGVSLVVAVAAALATTYAITYAAWRLVSGSRGSSEIRPADLEGAVGEVITPIPAGGMGEVAAMVAGQRFAGPAREEHGREVPRGTRVKVRSMVGATLVVSKGDS